MIGWRAQRKKAPPEDKMASRLREGVRDARLACRMPPGDQPSIAGPDRARERERKKAHAAEAEPHSKNPPVVKIKALLPGAVRAEQRQRRRARLPSEKLCVVFYLIYMCLCVCVRGSGGSTSGTTLLPT